MSERHRAHKIPLCCLKKGRIMGCPFDCSLQHSFLETRVAEPDTSFEIRWQRWWHWARPHHVLLLFWVLLSALTVRNHQTSLLQLGLPNLHLVPASYNNPVAGCSVLATKWFALTHCLTPFLGHSACLVKKLFISLVLALSFPTPSKKPIPKPPTDCFSHSPFSISLRKWPFHSANMFLFDGKRIII